jgi:hypothetical protein
MSWIYALLFFAVGSVLAFALFTAYLSLQYFALRPLLLRLNPSGRAHTACTAAVVLLDCSLMALWTGYCVVFGRSFLSTGNLPAPFFIWASLFLVSIVPGFLFSKSGEQKAEDIGPVRFTIAKGHNITAWISTPLIWILFSQKPEWSEWVAGWLPH